MEISPTNSQESDKEDLPILEMSIGLMQKNGKPCLELRRYMSNKDEIEFIVDCAINNKVFLALPTIKNKIKALSTLQELKIIERKDGQFFFVGDQDGK